jgi:hypothetical protein
MHSINEQVEQERSLSHLSGTMHHSFLKPNFYQFAYNIPLKGILHI